MKDRFQKSHFLTALLAVFALFAVATAFRTDVAYHPSWIAAWAFGNPAQPIDQTITASVGDGIILAQNNSTVTVQAPGNNSTVTTQVPGNNSTVTTGAPGNNSTVTTQVPGGTPPAQSSTQPTFTISNPLDSKFNTVGALVDGFVTIFAYLVIILAVILIIWTGLQYILASGNPDKMKKASIQLGWLVIGIAIVIGARLIVHIVINTLQATGTVNQNVIQNANNALSGQ